MEVFTRISKNSSKTFFMISWSISMNLYHTGLSELYREIEALGDPLTGISDRIDFERIRPILSDLYANDTDKGGRPNYDPVLMVKILLLQHWYNLSDP
jgi:IS5 family transposase